MFPKRIKMEMESCCVCGLTGYGFMDSFNIFLRENEVSKSFAEIIAFTLGIQVLQDSPCICTECRMKTVSFYHFKKRSHNNRSGSSFVQEIMKVVSSFTIKNGIKAVTIEESPDKLLIMDKAVYTAAAAGSRNSNLIITNVFENVKIKMEKEDEEEESEQAGESEQREEEANASRENDENCHLNVRIKTEPVDEDDENFTAMQNEPPPYTYENREELQQEEHDSREDKIDAILKLNREILSFVKKLNDKCSPQATATNSTDNI